MVRSAVISAAVAVALGSAAQAANYDFIGLNNQTSNWSDPLKWTNLSGGTGTFPGAGDVAEFKVAVDNWTTIEIQGGATVGSIYVKPRWGPYRIKTGWGGTPTFTINNNGADSVFTLTNHAGSNQTETNLVIGADGSAMRMSLANNLLIQNDPASVNPGRFALGNKATIIGGTAASRRTITIKTTTTRKVSAVIDGAATFVGDWVVDGDKSVLDMNANSFGDASNSVDLLNGGTLDLTHAAFDPATFSWNRSISGAGTILANANGFSVGAGSFDLVGYGAIADKLVIDGQLILSAGSTLNLTGTFSGDAIPLFVTKGNITGRFSTVNLPAGYDISYTGSGISLVVPEPAALGLIGGLGLVAVCRRRRQA